MASSLNAAWRPHPSRGMRIQYEKSLGYETPLNAIAESFLSGLPKCARKHAGISKGMRYRNAHERGTIYADLCGIRN